MPKPTIFVIDDDPDVRQSLQWLVRAVGFAPVHTYACAEDFLAAYRPEWAGCIVLDVQLPGMDGLELLARLEALGPHPPVLMITAYGDIRWRSGRSNAESSISSKNPIPTATWWGASGTRSQAMLRCSHSAKSGRGWSTASRSSPIESGT